MLGINKVSLEIAPGITGLVGPNGSGKTTLMNLLAGLLRPDRGELRVLGLTVDQPEELFRLVGYSTQYDAFPRGLPGFAFVRDSLRLHGYTAAAAEERAWQAIERVGLVEAAGRKVAAYSKGMRQRIKLARAIAHRPAVLILDEPLNGLDPMARAEMIDLFRHQADEGLHVLISSHILHEVDDLSDRVVLINGGYVVAEGEIEGVREEVEEQPIQVLVRCDRPALLAARLFQQDVGAGSGSLVTEVTVHEDRRGVLVRTRDADRFYLLLNRAGARRGAGGGGGGAGRRRRRRGLRVPDRWRRRQHVSEAMTSTGEHGASGAQRPRRHAGTADDHEPGGVLVAAPGSRRMRWAQLVAVTRIELARQILRRRALGAMVLAAVPVLMTLAWVLLDRDIPQMSLSDAATVVAQTYRGFTLNLVVFFGAVVIFSTLIRREVRDKTLHYHFLGPVRRDLLLVGKYLAGVLTGWLLFGLTTFLTFAIVYLRLWMVRPIEVGGFFTDGPGFAHLGAYLLVTVLAVLGYGAVFLALGMFFKNPVFPAIAVYGWELGNFLLPPVLKKVSVIHYLSALLPVPIEEGPFALLAELPSPWLAVPGLVALAAVLVTLAAWKIRRMEVLYGED